MNKIKLPILYKRSNLLNKINQWQIIVEDDSFYTISGYVDGKLFTGDKTICIPKNVGKKNATTVEEQALFEAKAMWQKRVDSGYWENINDCDKKVVFQPMLAKDFTKEKIKYPIASSVKLDGIRCIAKSDGLWTRTGKPILSAPHIFESLKHLFEENEDLIFDGELYTSNKEVDFNTIVSCVRKTKPTQEDLNLSEQYIEYHIYDLPSDPYPYIFRMTKLNTIISNLNDSNIKYVGYEVVNNEQQVKEKLSQYISEGYEGQMLRVLDSLYENKRSKFLLKHKTFIDEEFTIIGYSEGIGKFSSKLATLKVDVNGIVVDCTINGTMSYLEELFQIKESLIGKLATVKYFEKTTDGSLRFPKIININRESYE